MKIEFINSTRGEIYRLNLNYKVRFHLIIIDLNIIISERKRKRKGKKERKKERKRERNK